MPPEQREQMRDKWQSMPVENVVTLREQLRQATPEQRMQIRRELRRVVKAAVNV